MDETETKNTIENERINVLKFYYEMLQDEIDNNSARGNLYKTIIIPIALGALGFAIQQDKIIISFIITVVGATALINVLLIDLVFTIANRGFIDKQKEIEEIIKEELKTDYLVGLRCPDSGKDKEYKFPKLEWLRNKVINSKWHANDFFTFFIFLYSIFGIIIIIFIIYQKWFTVCPVS